MWHSAGMTVIEDLAAEQDRLDTILSGLTGSQWLTESAAAGWTVADVVLHLAQSEEGVASVSTASVSGAGLRSGSVPAGPLPGAGLAMDDRAAEWVRRERDSPDVVFTRWRTARQAALTALRDADPERPVQWVIAPMKPATLATTRLAEHWAHGLDITGPLGLDLPDTSRLRHVAWLAYRTLPYALSVAGAGPLGEVRLELTAPDGAQTWSYGPPDAESVIRGPAGIFCRVAARRLAPDASRLALAGPDAAAALRAVRTYAA